MFNMLLAEPNSNWILLVVMAVLIVALLAGSFIMQKRNKKKAENTKSNLKVGDVIVTIGGIKGEICSINDLEDTIDVKTGEGTIITFFKGAIQAINPQFTPVAPVTAPVKEETLAVEAEVEVEKDIKDETVGH